MHRSKIAFIASFLIVSVLLLAACAKVPGDLKAEAASGALNTSYVMGKETITLVNGMFEKQAAPGSAAMNKTQVWDQPVIGDLNVDGKEDAAVCLINTPGGSGTFYYIAAALKNGSGKSYKGTNAIFLGDRIQISKISIENNIITVVYNETKADKAMTSAPSLTVSKKFRVENSMLREIASGTEKNEDNSGSITNKPAYTLIKTVDKNNNKVSYPQISGLKGELLSGYMNQSLKKILDKYSDKDYSNVTIDYVVTRQDDKVLSVLFKGKAEKKNIGIIQIMESTNLVIGKSSNEIKFDNLIKDTNEAKSYLKNKLNQTAERKGIKGGFQAEGVRIYFTNTEIVFFYMPPDDSAREFVELSIPKVELEQYLNCDFGPVPAS